MNILVSGAAGFIGSHMVDLLLSKGHNVVGVDCYSIHGGCSPSNLDEATKNGEFRFVEYPFDICDTKSILSLCRKYKIEWILNFAAETHVDRSIVDVRPFIHSNIEGVASLLEVCRQQKTKLFHISTDEVYGPWQDEQDQWGYPNGFREDAILNPQNPYSATKAAAEHMIKAYHNTYGVNYMMVRPANNFGPRQDKEKLIPTIVQSILNHNPIPVYGDGLQVRDWLYVGSTVKMIEKLMNDKEQNRTFNLTLKHERHNIDIVKFAIETFGKGEIEFVEDRPGHDKKYCIDGTNTPVTDDIIGKGFILEMKETFEWYAERYLEEQKRFWGDSRGVSYTIDGITIKDAK